MTGPDRRTFVKRVAAASAGAAAASLVPGTAVGAGLGRSLGELGLSWEKAPCALCGVGCGLLLGVENGRAAAVRGDPASGASRGLACAKGYHAVQALYARDRLRTARVRRGGELVEVPMAEALDLVARTLGETASRHGRDSVAIYGSGQWTIPAAYVATKLFKGVLGTNNVDTSARLSSGSAAAGLRASFGLDAPLGCHEDLDNADVFVLWDTNMAEEYPVLFSRMLAHRHKEPRTRIVDVGTRTTRTSYAADRGLLFDPDAGLAIANAICHEIVDRGQVHQDFVRRHVSFRKGKTGIGYGRADRELTPDDGAEVDFDDFVRFLADYTPERAARMSGLPAADIRWLASIYADPALRVTTAWGAGVNRHARGTWMNTVLHNIHLLVGKVGSPGNSPLPLSAETSGCGSGREVGASAHGLPAGTVTRREDRERAAGVWGVPLSNIQGRPGHHALSMFRALEEGDIRFLWIQRANPMVDLPNLDRQRSAVAREDRFVVVSDAYPTATTDLADVVLPSALWVEEEGLFGSGERRIQHFDRMVEAPGEAMGEAWQLIEVARRLGHEKLFPWDRDGHVAGVWEEYARFRDSAADRLPPLPVLRSRPGALWPYVDGRETGWRYSTAHDPAADPARGAVDFYGLPEGRARIWLRPWEPPSESPDADYPFRLVTGAVLEHAGTGTLTRRVPNLHRAAPRAYAEVNAEDARELGIRNGDRIRLTSRRGELVIQARIDHRAQPPRGQIFVPSFDEGLPVHRLTLDSHCPISGQPDYSCAVRVERVGAAS